MREPAIVFRHAFGKTGHGPLGQLELVGGGEPAAAAPARQLQPVLVPIPLPFFLGPHREGLVHLGRARRCRPAPLLLQLRDALPGCFQLPLEGDEEIDEPIHVDTSLAHVFLQLVDGVHADSIGNPPLRSCASFHDFSPSENGQLFRAAP
jgi:hypothetical protein